MKRYVKKKVLYDPMLDGGFLPSIGQGSKTKVNKSVDLKKKPRTRSKGLFSA